MALIDIYVVDTSKPDIVMSIDMLLTPNDTGVKDVSSMVSFVTRKCIGGIKLRELRILGHGRSGGQYFGGDWIDDVTLPAYSADLRRIAHCFDSTGFVTLGGCKVGQNQIFLAKLSHIFGVPVRAFTASQNPIIPGDEGSEIRCLLLACKKGDYTALDRIGY